MNFYKHFLYVCIVKNHNLLIIFSFYLVSFISQKNTIQYGQLRFIMNKNLRKHNMLSIRSQNEDTRNEIHKLFLLPYIKIIIILTLNLVIIRILNTKLLISSY